MGPADRISFTLRSIIVVSAVAASVGVVAASTGAASQEVADELLAQGEEIYADQCESCHGPGGKGDGPAARFLDPKPRDFTSGDWEHAEGGTVEAVVRVLVEGVDDTGMTPFDELLSEEEMNAVASYVVYSLANPGDGDSR